MLSLANHLREDSAILLSAHDRIIFFGDSITEADPGYVSFIKKMLDGLFPDLGFEIINKGIGGNKVGDLLARVERDIIALDPDIVSVAIGINDAWHMPHGTPLPEFEAGMTELFEILKTKTTAKILVCTPSVLGEDPETEEARSLEDWVSIVRKTASAAGLQIVEIHNAFLDTVARAADSVEIGSVLTTDGVHLNDAGNILYATTWLKAAGAFEALP